MIRKLSLLLLLGILSASSMQASDSVTRAVIAGEKARNAALLAGDVNAVAAVLADDLRYIHSTGKLESKADILKAVTAKTLAYQRMETLNLNVAEVTPGVAVLTGTIDQRKLTPTGSWTDAKLLFQAVWRLDGGAWRLVAMQTALPPAPAK
ncbi:MAG: nuclear transport factor 2 family protein [Opitutaceae bacterium]|nr:nuclear transport factor 2 family protein [Opitutaceae bacterium]